MAKVRQTGGRFGRGGSCAIARLHESRAPRPPLRRRPIDGAAEFPAVGLNRGRQVLGPLCHEHRSGVPAGIARRPGVPGGCANTHNLRMTPIIGGRLPPYVASGHPSSLGQGNGLALDCSAADRALPSKGGLPAVGFAGLAGPASGLGLPNSGGNPVNSPGGLLTNESVPSSGALPLFPAGGWRIPAARVRDTHRPT